MKHKMEPVVLPHRCISIDTSLQQAVFGLQKILSGNVDRQLVISQLQDMWTKPANRNCVLPCLSVRTVLDLYLRVKNFPAGSEMIMSAINIPTMVEVVKHHGLVPVPLDIDIDTMRPKVELVDSVVSSKTVGILVAHLYGKHFDMEPVIQIGKRYKISVIEDCAEAFCGFDMIGHPEADLSLFSFGVLKFCTALGGAVAKIRDRRLYEAMTELYKTYPMQSSHEYGKKILKYTSVYSLLTFHNIGKLFLLFSKLFGVDSEKLVINKLRGFPNNLIGGIRQQPCDALLAMMHHRFSHFNPSDFHMMNMKGDYVSERLPDQVMQIGFKADVRHYWLFPIIVENADEFVNTLVSLGVNSYRSASQLNMIEPPNGKNQSEGGMQHFVTHYPHEAKYLMDHLVYLPVHKSVPFHHLDELCRLVRVAFQQMSEKKLPPLNPRLKSKL